MSNIVLTGAARRGFKNRVASVIREAFPQAGQSKPTGKQGRPVTTTLADLANNYMASVPGSVHANIMEDGKRAPERAAAFLDLLVENRRYLTPDEAEYLPVSRDARPTNEGGAGMPLRKGEPGQEEFYMTIIVAVQNDRELLSDAFLRTYENLAAPMAQQVANTNGETIHVIVERMCIERNARNPKMAQEAIEKGEPFPISMVGLMSNVKCAITLTNVLKTYRGALLKVGSFEPQGRKTTLKVVTDREQELAAA